LEAHQASRTAIGVSLLRAEHARDDADPVIFDDWGDRLVPESERQYYRDIALARLEGAEREAALADSRHLLRDFFKRQNLYGSILLRQRWCEDALAEVVAGGLDQYVIVGAGFDSLALRRPPFARDLKIFEIDHPATQALKRERMAAAGHPDPALTTYVAADLAAESVDAALARTGFDPARPAFFAWLGVTIYLTREANLATLAAIARVGAPGSRLAFTYGDTAIFKPAAAGGAMADSFRVVERMREPWVSGFDPAELPGLLSPMGYAIVEDVHGPDLAARYGRVGERSLPVSALSRCALIEVIG
jgi:methyltransferase (TIGR00027 family)